MINAATISPLFGLTPLLLAGLVLSVAQIMSPAGVPVELSLSLLCEFKDIDDVIAETEEVDCICVWERPARPRKDREDFGVCGIV